MTMMSRTGGANRPHHPFCINPTHLQTSDLWHDRSISLSTNTRRSWRPHRRTGDDQADGTGKDAAGPSAQGPNAQGQRPRNGSPTTVFTCEDTVCKDGSKTVCAVAYMLY